MLSCLLHCYHLLILNTNHVSWSYLIHTISIFMETSDIRDLFNTFQQRSSRAGVEAYI